MGKKKRAASAWSRRLLGVAAAALLALGVAVPSVALADSGSGIVDRAPEHHKTIKDNGDGTYDLTLSVTGDTEQSSSAKPVDVVFVVDVSSSMNDKVSGWRGKSRMKAAHDAVEALANELLTGENANKQIQVSVVTFGTNAQVATSFTSDPNVVANAVPTEAEEDQGTNWEDGLKLANAQASSREGAEKHVVFLSDGNPTYRVSPMGYSKWDEINLLSPDHKVNDNLYGLGSSDTDDGRCYAAAKAEANNRNGANLFVVSVAKDADRMTSFATDTNGTFLDGTTADNLASAFSQIGQVITKSVAYKDVKVVDVLSQWVEGTAADGTVENVRYAKDGQAWATAPQATITGGAVAWDLSSAGELEKGVTYSMTFTVRPNAAARADVAAKGSEQTYPTNDGSATYVEYKTISKQTGQADVISAAKTAPYEEPQITLAAPAPVTIDGAADLAGHKTLNGRDLAAGEFSFTISTADGSAADTPLPAETTVSNDADGSFHFGDIEFAKTGTYLYDVVEDTSALPAGVKAVTQGAERVEVDVTVNDAGELVASVKAPEGGLSFVNEYGTNDAVVSVSATKAIVANGLEAPALIDGDFSFTIFADTEGAPLPDETTVTNRGGNVSFGPMTFAKAMLGDEMSKTFDYTISESGSKPGVTNDSAKSFSVTVTDDGKGNLTAEMSGPVSFANTYAVAPLSYSISRDVSVKKELAGRDLHEGEFSFELLEGDDVVATATNAADGTVTFPELTYDAPGEHSYTVREVAGDAAGVSYDTTAYAVSVKVSDNGDGTLSAAASGDTSVTFKNVYEAAPATVTLNAKKVLEGAELADGEFTFRLENGGQLMDEATNDADGNVTFHELTLKQAGTYTFTVSEIAGSEEGVTYDSSQKTVTVTVTDDGNGQLQASVEGNGQTFTNTYVKPAAGDTNADAGDADKAIPQTGDTNNAALPIVVAAVAVACIAGGLVASHKRK
ncbi:Spy0128 family protein [Parolsenella catena]|uniref:Spy0128 family protein n=1 Tax=Parolsenella catena TaxID=2003188 RepID=UPI00294314DD|nr:FctA domain-containing protein [Parolsenella catena]